MSALKLLLYYCKEIKTVEEIYQKSKVYDNNNHITLFKYKDIEFPNYPIGMYYDYLYMCALYQHNDLREELFNYDYFTDIEFNPNKSKNTQARAAAIFKTLEYNNETRSLLLHMKDFQDYYYVKQHEINTYKNEKINSSHFMLLNSFLVSLSFYFLYAIPLPESFLVSLLFHFVLDHHNNDIL